MLKLVVTLAFASNALLLARVNQLNSQRHSTTFPVTYFFPGRARADIKEMSVLKLTPTIFGVYRQERHYPLGRDDLSRNFLLLRRGPFSSLILAPALRNCLVTFTRYSGAQIVFARFYFIRAFPCVVVVPRCVPFGSRHVLLNSPPAL